MGFNSDFKGLMVKIITRIRGGIRNEKEEKKQTLTFNLLAPEFYI